MSERVAIWLVVLAVGVVLIVASALEVGGTPYTRAGLIGGGLLASTGVGTIAALLWPRPRKPRSAVTPGRPAHRPARAHPGCPTKVDAGRVCNSPSPEATAVLPAVAWSATPVRRPSVAGVADLIPTMEFRPRGSGVTPGRMAAGDARGSLPAAPMRRSLGSAPQVERPALPLGGGQVWTTAGPELYPQVEGPQRCARRGPDETRHT